MSVCVCAVLMSFSDGYATTFEANTKSSKILGTKQQPASNDKRGKRNNISTETATFLITMLVKYSVCNEQKISGAADRMEQHSTLSLTRTLLLNTRHHPRKVDSQATAEKTCQRNNTNIKMGIKMKLCK